MKRSQKLAIWAALVMGANFNSHVSASDTDYVYFNGQKFIPIGRGYLLRGQNSLPPGRFLLKQRKIFKMPGR